MRQNKKLMLYKKFSDNNIIKVNIIKIKNIILKKKLQFILFPLLLILSACGGGGGSGGGGNPGRSGSGGTGGKGGVGFFSAPIVQPFSQPYTIGTGGAAGPGSTAGNATTFTNVGTANGGARGNNAPGTPPGNTGAAGTAPGAAFTYPVYPFQVGGPNTLFDGGAGGPPGLGGVGAAGNPGIIAVFENDGT